MLTLKSYMELKVFSVLILSCFISSFKIETHAQPLRAPPLSHCPKISDCCIRPSEKIIDFKLPTTKTPLRVRRATHLVDEEYKRKYENATRLMKQLPADHPWNFMRQAAIHCAYAADKLPQMNHDWPFEIHDSWLFYPFHRAYLYFYERILGKLIEDETFALPFWNWDNPDGMGFPSIYKNVGSSLYENTRYPSIMPPNILSYGSMVTGSGKKKTKEVINNNLESLHRTLVSNYEKIEEFMGGAYREGHGFAEHRGSLENGEHGIVHMETGATMLDVVISARDPVFYAHHANVDRLWETWRNIHGGIRMEFSDPDWLNTTFVFWDENVQLVHIKVRDVLEMERLWYTYEKVPLLWLSTNSTIIRQLEVPTSLVAQAASVTHDTFPMILGNTSVRIPLFRKAKMFEQFHKCTGKEVILVKGIKFKSTDRVWFDVYVSVQPSRRLSTRLSFDATQKLPSIWCGKFAHVLTGTRNREEQHDLTIRLDDVLTRLGAEHKNMILVTFAPREMTNAVEIGSVEINCVS